MNTRIEIQNFLRDKSDEEKIEALRAILLIVYSEEVLDINEIVQEVSELKHY